ncbi:MAG: 50S ribosomal protein L23 [bacterium]
MRFFNKILNKKNKKGIKETAEEAVEIIATQKKEPEHLPSFSAEKAIAKKSTGIDISEKDGVKKQSEKKQPERKTKEAKKEKVTEVKKLKKLPLYSISDKVILSPLVTEKAAVAESFGKYTFLVAKWSTKNNIKKAMEEIYGIRPTGITIMNIDGRKTTFRRTRGRRQDYKKAVVTLQKGKSIDVHKGV